MLSIINKYYTPGTQLYEILIRHSEAVRDKALAIAAAHPEMNIDTQFIAEAAMIHDIGIVRCDAAGICCFGTHQYMEHGILGAEMMRAEGLERHALVCEHHTGAGLTAADIIANQWPLPHRDMLPTTIEERLICYADKFYSKTRLDSEDSITRIRAKIARWGNDSLQRFDALHREFSIE